jgi:hypothetical protein
LEEKRTKKLDGRLFKEEKESQALTFRPPTQSTKAKRKEGTKVTNLSQVGIT